MTNKKKFSTEEEQLALLVALPAVLRENPFRLTTRKQFNQYAKAAAKVLKLYRKAVKGPSSLDYRQLEDLRGQLHATAVRLFVAYGQYEELHDGGSSKFNDRVTEVLIEMAQVLIPVDWFERMQEHYGMAVETLREEAFPAASDQPPTPERHQ